MSSSNVTKHIQQNDVLLVLATLVLFDGILSSETAADFESRALLLAFDLVLLTEAC